MSLNANHPVAQGCIKRWPFCTLDGRMTVHASGTDFPKTQAGAGNLEDSANAPPSCSECVVAVMPGLAKMFQNDTYNEKLNGFSDLT